MIEKRRWLAFALATVLVFALFGCGDDDDDAEYVPEPEPKPTLIFGRAAQTYVADALVLADRITSGSTGNFAADAKEIPARTDGAGSFTLTIPPAYGDYVLFVSGGTVTDSQGNQMEALPMLAPRGARNITPVTTLVALNPGLREKIGPSYDADIADPAGVDGAILQLAKATEAVLDLLTRKSPAAIQGIENQMRIYAKLADILVKPDTDLKDDQSLSEAIYMAAAAVLLDNAIEKDETVLAGDAFGIANILARAAGGILMQIPEDQTVTEADILPIYEGVLAQVGGMLTGTAFAFDPASRQIPFPNDLAWAQTGGTVDLPVQGTDLSAAFYTAVNSLELRGFSPNTPISIPMTAPVQLDPNALKNNIRLINLNMLMGALFQGLNLGNPLTTPPDQILPAVLSALAEFPAANWPLLQQSLREHFDLFYDARVKVRQEDEFLKISPLQPLSPGATYLVYVMAENPETLDQLTDGNGLMVRPPALYPALLGDAPLTGELTDLEPLRRKYAPLADLVLRTVGVDAKNLLHMFTFTTAARTLSSDDFGKIMAYGAGMGITSLDELSALIKNSPNLPYTADRELTITSEYGAIREMLPPMTAVDMPASGFFISVDLQSPTQEQIPVPYTLYNPDGYDGTVTIYLHGLGQRKENAHSIAPLFDEPVIAMDLPLHGARTVEGADSGYGFFSSNLPATRLNFYQSYFDMNLLLRNLKAGLFNLDGDEDINLPGEEVTDADDIPANIRFISQSFGSIIGSVFVADNIADIDRIAMAVGGADFAALLDQATNPEIAGLADALGVEKNSFDYFVALGVAQTILDPADPVFLARGVDAEKTLLLSAYQDTYVPNISNEILAITIGHETLHRVMDFSDPVPAGAGWYMYGGAPGMEKNWMGHSFMMTDNIDFYTVAGPHLNPAYVSAAHAAVWEQIRAFFLQ